jgi:heme-binding uptake protein ChaN (Tiki superfamily)
MRLLLLIGTLVLPLALGRPADVPMPDEVAGVDAIVRILISAFDRVDVVALGEDHGEQRDSDLRVALVRHPDFAKKVRFIVVEFGTVSQQSLLDRYIQGEQVAQSQLEQVWKTTRAGRAGVWNSPMYADFFAAVRDVNSKLPGNEQIRVLGGDPGPGNRSRDVAAASLLKEQVLEKHGKALVIYGAAHFYRTQGDASPFLGAGGGIVQILEVEYPGRTLVVIPIGPPTKRAPAIAGVLAPDYQKFDRALKTPTRPVLVSLARAPFRDFTAEEFIGDKLVDCKGAAGCVSVFKGSTLTLGQMADVGVYFGASTAMPEGRLAR